MKSANHLAVVTAHLNGACVFEKNISAATYAEAVMQASVGMGEAVAKIDEIRTKLPDELVQIGFSVVCPSDVIQH